MVTAVIMILRVWAMYNRSKLIFNALLTLFSLEFISFIIACAAYTDPRNLSGTLTLAKYKWYSALTSCPPPLHLLAAAVATGQILDFSFCVVQTAPPTWDNMAAILQITHGIAMCILVIIQGVRQSLQMYHVTKQWQLNRYMKMLVQQEILYFFVCVTLCLIL